MSTDLLWTDFPWAGWLTLALIAAGITYEIRMWARSPSAPAAAPTDGSDSVVAYGAKALARIVEAGADRDRVLTPGFDVRLYEAIRRSGGVGLDHARGISNLLLVAYPAGFPPAVRDEFATALGSLPVTHDNVARAVQAVLLMRGTIAYTDPV